MKGNLEYSSYLNIDKLLELQNLESSKDKDGSAHEEMLFIITHQTYEIWFKQILWEIKSVIKILQNEFVPDDKLSLCVHRMRRVNEIWKLLISQIGVLETMTPMEFLEFRNHLYPASGFQSFQFRMIENSIGLKEEERKKIGGCPYHQFLPEERQTQVRKEEENNLREAVESWLERTPYLKSHGYDFWTNYKDSVRKMFSREKDLVNRSHMSESEKQNSLRSIEKSLNGFEDFLAEEKFNASKAKGEWKLSFQSLHAALFIQLYRHEPKIRTAFNLIEELINLDEHMTHWRIRHAQMALRMLGQKMGTGGSSGETYLKEAAHSHKVFLDFFKLTTFFIRETELDKPVFSSKDN